jgi:L-2,4-diaminobutyric acid acetyltransferase
MLWCHDFADSSVVAKVEGETVGFVTAYRKPVAPDTAVVWQVAVDASQRGKGLAGALLEELFTKLVGEGVRYLETTIAPDNEASIRLFSSFAKRWKTGLESAELFRANDFPDDGEGAHEPEDLYRIGPLARQ